VAGILGRMRPAPRQVLTLLLRALHPLENCNAHTQKINRAHARLRDPTEQCWGLFTVMI
jgi:hypothetical protein